MSIALNNGPLPNSAPDVDDEEINLGELLGESKAIPSPPAAVAVGIPADLLRRRPDIRQAEQQAAAQSVLDGLRRDFAGADIHYWLTPVSEFGHLG